MSAESPKDKLVRALTDPNPALFFASQKSSRGERRGGKPSDDAQVITLVLAALDKIEGNGMLS